MFRSQDGLFKKSWSHPTTALSSTCLLYPHPDLSAVFMKICSLMLSNKPLRSSQKGCIYNYIQVHFIYYLVDFWRELVELDVSNFFLHLVFYLYNKGHNQVTILLDICPPYRQKLKVIWLCICVHECAGVCVCVCTAWACSQLDEDHMYWSG